MNQDLLEQFAGECERLAEEKETEREWLSDFANMVLEEGCKDLERQLRFKSSADAVIHRNAQRYMFLRCMSVREYADLVSEVLQSGVDFDSLVDDMIEEKSFQKPLDIV